MLQHYWWLAPCPAHHPPGHCRLCLTFHVDIDGQRWVLPDDERSITIESAHGLIKAMPTDYDDHVLRRKKPQPNPKPR